MRCLEKEKTAQHTGLVPGERQEEPGLETTHRAQNLQVLSTPTPSRLVQNQQIKWLQAKQHRQWLQFDEDTSRIINTMAKGDIEGWLKNQTTIITNFGAERFGVEEAKPNKPTYTNNCRADKIHQKENRKELQMLTRQLKAATEEEKPPLAELCLPIQKKLKTLPRAEWHRRWRMERARTRSSFLTNLFAFTKWLLGLTSRGQLDCPKGKCRQLPTLHLQRPRQRARAWTSEIPPGHATPYSGV